MSLVRWKKLARIAATPAYWRALARGVAAGTEHEAVLSSRPPRTVVDVGANRGQFALVARRVSPDARILAFEPLAEPARSFRGLFAGDPRVTLHEIALGSADGVAEIHVSRLDDSSSLLPITARQEAVFPGTGERRVDTVTVRTLAGVVAESDLEPPALLKIDVQGFELRVLEGAGSLLGAFDRIYVECSFGELYAGHPLAADVIAALAARGFALSGVFNVTRDRGVAIQADFLFAPRRP